MHAVASASFGLVEREFTIGRRRRVVTRFVGTGQNTTGFANWCRGDRIRTHEGLRHGIASSLYEMFWILSFDTRNAFEVSVSGNDAAYFGVFHYSHMGTIVWADTMLVKDVNGIPDV